MVVKNNSKELMRIFDNSYYKRDDTNISLITKLR